MDHVEAGGFLATLRYNDEVKDVTGIFAGVAQVRANQDVIQMANNLVKRRSRAFEPDVFRNHYYASLRELVEVICY